MPAFRADRLDQVFLAMAAMAPHDLIERELSAKWGVRARTVKRYVAEAERILAMQAADPKSLEERREFLSTAATLLYRKQFAAQHYASAARTLDMMARWYGIGTPQLTTAIHLHAPNGAMTAQAAIAADVARIEAEQAARVEQLAKELAGAQQALPAGTDDDAGGDDGGSVH